MGQHVVLPPTPSTTDSRVSARPCEPHYWKPEFVDEEVPENMSAFWYSNSTFDFENCFLMKRFLTEDRWKTGQIPGQLVRNVRYLVGSLCWPAMTLAERFQRQHTFRNNIGKMTGLKKGAKITVSINIDSDSCWGRPDIKEAYRAAFEDTFPALYQLRSSGYQITISPSHHQNFAFNRDPFPPR